MPHHVVVGESSLCKVSYTGIALKVFGAILTAWKTKQWHEPVSFSTARTPPLSCRPSWSQSNVSTRQSTSTGRQWEQVASNPTNSLTGTSATDIDRWPCRLSSTNKQPIKSCSQSNPLHSAPLMSTVQTTHQRSAVPTVSQRSDSRSRRETRWSGVSPQGNPSHGWGSMKERTSAVWRLRSWHCWHRQRHHID